MHRFLPLLLLVCLARVDAQPHVWSGAYYWTRRGVAGFDTPVFINAYLLPDKSGQVIEVWDPFFEGPIARKVLPDKYQYEDAKSALSAAFNDTFPGGTVVFNRQAQGLPTNNLYLAARGPVESIRVLSPATFELLASLDVAPRLPGGLGFSPDSKTLYATLWRSTTATPPLPAQIAIIDTASNQLTGRITLTPDMLPSQPSVSPDNKLLYFADSAEGLVVIDLESQTVVDKIPASRAGGANNRFHNLALSPDGSQMYLVDSFGISVLDTRTRTFTARVVISLPNRSIPPLVHPNGSRLYLIERRTVSGGLAITLVTFDTSTMTEVFRTALPSTFDPNAAVITPDGLQIAMDGLLRPSGAPNQGVFLLFQTATNQLAVTDGREAQVGALAVMLQP